MAQGQSLDELRDHLIEGWSRVGDLERALHWLERARIEESETEARLALEQRRVELLAALDRLAEARREGVDLLESAALADEDRRRLHERLGRWALRDGDDDAALQHLRAAWEAGSEDARAMEALATLHLRRDEHRAAAEALQRAAEHARPTAETLDRLALTWLRAGERDAARAALRRRIVEYGLDEHAERIAGEWATSLTRR